MRSYLFTVLTFAKILIKRFFRDKTALFFTFVFPLIFLFVFGGIFGSSNQISFNVALINNSQTEFADEFVNNLSQNELFEVTTVDTVEQAEEQLGRGEYDVIVQLPESFGSTQNGTPNGTVVTYYDESDEQLAQTFNSVMNSILENINQQFVPTEAPFTLENRSLQTANLSQFDYVFSGLIGFTILSLGFFGLANGFPADKKAGVLSRLRSTPLRPSQLILATALQYLLIGLLAVAMMFVVGVVVFDFTMRGDYFSFIVFTTLGIIAMFGFGLAIAGWAKNENQAAPLANLVAFPMMFLSGVFFPRFLMPDWLQNIATYIPLSPIVDGLRFIMTEGQTLLQLGSELLIIGAWIIVIYSIAAKTFRWE